MKRLLVCAAMMGCANGYVNGAALASSTAALACDWGQTRWAASREWPRGKWETNPVMGAHPTSGTVDAYFAFAALANAAIWLATPRRFRSAIPVALAIGEAKQVADNLGQAWPVPMCGL